MQICVIAKEPRPGFAKTRLTPPCTPVEAAAIAEASLADTLAVVASTPASRKVLALDGGTGAWLPDGFEVIAQCAGGLDRRLEDAFRACFDASDEPVVLIGMDTPQVRSDHLLESARMLDGGIDAVLGPATDGGYWLIGLRAPVPGAFVDVPMSTEQTYSAQTNRLERLGCSVGVVQTLDDVDSFDEARRVARHHRQGRFARAVERVGTDSVPVLT